MKNRITVKLKLSPLAWQIIKRDFDFEIFAYNISGSYIYDIVKSQLTKSPEENISDDGKYEVHSIFISEHDFFQHGAVIKPEGHLLISHIIEKIERTNICNFVAIAAARGAKKDTALKHYLFENDKYLLNVPVPPCSTLFLPDYEDCIGKTVLSSPF